MKNLKHRAHVLGQGLINNPGVCLVGLGSIVFYLLCIVIAGMLDTAGFVGDFAVYRSAVSEFLANRDPYVIPGSNQFHNPPWTLFLVLPFVVLPAPLGHATIIFATLLVYIYIVYKRKASLLSVVCFLLSVPVFTCLQYGQIDAFVLLGFVLPPQIGIILLLMKPQVSGILILYLVYVAYREGGFTSVIALLGPAIFVFLCSLFWFGFWPLNWITSARILSRVFWFPTLVPFGILLVIMAFWRDDGELALIAPIFLSPHVLTYSLSGVLLCMLDRPIVLFVVVVISWIAQYYLCQGG